MKPVKNRDKLDSRQKKYLKQYFGIRAYKDLVPKVLADLKEALKELTDSRESHKRVYKIWDVVCCVIVCVLCGKKTWEEIHDFIEEKYEFFKKFLKMTGGIPCSKTIERIMAIVDHKELENILVQFFFSITQNLMDEIDLINIDGRECRGSKRKETLKQEGCIPLNMLNVYSNKYGLCIYSEQIGEKTEEMKAVKKIIPVLNVKDAILTWDALNSQKDNVEAVVDAFAHYVIPIKGNHPKFSEELKEFFDEKEQECIIAGKTNTGYKKETEYKNGFIVSREYFQTTEIDWFEDKYLWKNLRSFGMVKTTKEGKEESTVEYRYFISDLDINIETFSRAIRNHWSIENKLHWHLDVTFSLDKNKTKDKRALASLEIIHKFNLGLLEKVQKYYGISKQRIIGKLGTNVEENFPEFLAFLTLANGMSDEK